MSYHDQATLAADPAFTARVNACGVQQAQLFVENSDDPGEVAYALFVVQTGNTGALVANVAARPGMSAESTDEDVLAAVQYVWPLIGAAYVPPT